MDSQQFVNLKQILKEGEILLLHHDGKIQIQFKNTFGKKCYRFMGILEFFDEIIIPIKSKLWATPPIPGKQKYYKFGEPLPKFDKREDEIKIKIKKWMLAFEALKSLDFTPKVSYWVDTYMKFTYYVEELNGIKIYFDSEEKLTPRYIEFEGERLIIPQLKPELKNQIFKNIKDVK
jgi:hypothetical protein